MTKVQSKNALLFDLVNDGGPLREALVETIGEGTTAEAGLISPEDKTKLDGIASGATVNAADAALRDRATHTGEQAISTITGLATALAGKATPADVAAALAGLVDSSPATLDTLNELAAALGDDPAFATTVSTALGNRLRVDAAQGLSAPQQAQGRSNLGLGSAALADFEAITPFESRVAATAAAIPAPVVGISVAHDGHILRYVEDPEGTALTTNAGGRKWSPAGDATANHWGLVAGDSPSNHVAINAAISFLGGGRKLTVLPGSYGLSGRIEVDHDHQIIDGVWRTAEFYKMPGYVHTAPMVEARLGTTGVGIIGLKLDGRDTGMGPAILVRGDHCSVIGNEVYSHGSNAAGFPLGNAIYLDGELASSGYIEGSIVTGNYVHDGLGCGTAQYHSKRAKICGNKYENLGLEGITCDRTATEGTIIDGNHIKNVCTAAGVGGIGLDGSCDVIVRSNHIDGTGVGSLSGVAAPGIGFQNNLGDTSNVQICGNTIKRAASYGIHCRTTGANAAGPGGTTVNVFIDGNICLDNAFGSVKADAGTTGTLGTNIYDGVPPDVPNTWPGREIAFKVHQSTDLGGITGDFTTYVIPYNSEVMDEGGCIALGVFTAPRRGIYEFAAGCQVRDVAADHTDMELSIVPSAGAVFRAKERLGGAGSYGATVSALIELAAGATVHVAVRVGGGANSKQVDINSADSPYNYFWGRIVVETT